MPLRPLCSAAILAGALLGAPLPGRVAHAQDGEAVVQPASEPAPAGEPATGRLLATATAGLALRLSKNVDFGQGILAPWYLDLFGGYVFASADRYQHGLGLGLAFNLSGDGGYTEPVDPASQWLIMPSYLGYLELGPDFFGLGHIGVPVLLTGTRSVGLEIGAGAAYRLLAGLGLYTELSVAAFAGASSTLHPLLSWELGLALDYEVLP